ncbi:MAG: serine/threonine protein kinase, partial [Candidatus Eisenbacteria bacterium]|nr:serine/threonine protein kinase [Candidatus Eisenbacteria bacterium]
MIPNRLGPYEVVRELGGGGAGRVYLVTTPRGPAALKLLLPGWDLPEARRRFRMEAEALRRLDHPGFVRYLDHGDELQTPHGVRPFLLMEYVEGSSLRSWIRPGGRPVDEVLPILEGLASALDYAHERGVVHRDLKPENVLLESGTGRPRILDLGIARLPENWRETLDVATHTGELLGTVRYMSPEQVRGQVAECGPASDVYSLAVVLYELLTGRLPYAVEHETLHELLAAILTARPESLRRSGMSLPAALDRTIRLSLAKEPRARPQSAGGFAREVRAVASGDRRQQLRAVWRELRHTGAFPVRRVVLGIVLLASAAWIMHGRLAPSRPDFPSVYRQLQTAVELVHFGERSPDRLRAAIDALSSAREGVWSHEFSWRGPLERYIVLRLAEAGYLLGDMEEDPERLRWSEAR